MDIHLPALPDLISVQPTAEDEIDSDELDLGHPFDVGPSHQFLSSVFQGLHFFLLSNSMHVCRLGLRTHLCLEESTFNIILQVYLAIIEFSFEI
jgi:hypothetical protein